MEQKQTDKLAAETRRLLDAATPGPWHCVVDDSAGKDQLELWCDYDDGSWREGMTAPFHLDPFCYDPTPMERATAALIAAAPRLLANWLACGQADDRQVQALIDANRDLADENRALREGIEKLIRWAESYRMHHVAIALRDLLAAADRGVTDGDRNEGDER